MKELLLLLCHYPYDDKNKEILSKLLGDVDDWQKLVALINAHGIIALAAYNIKEAGLEKQIPEDSMAILENGYIQSIVRNTWLAERWNEVNTILGNAGIKHVLLKGMALEHTLYDAKGLRQMNDNDILVKRKDAVKARALLLDNGFSQELIKSSLHKKIMLETGKHLPCLYKNGYAVEIHHKLFNNLTKLFDFEDPVDSAVQVTIGNTKAWILSKEFQSAHLSDHFKRHICEGIGQLRQYADIILFDKTSKVEFPDNFIINPNQENDTIFRKTAYKINIKCIDSRYRFRYIVGDIFPSIKWMKERYRCSALSVFLYYPHRLGKLWWLV